MEGNKQRQPESTMETNNNGITNTPESNTSPQLPKCMQKLCELLSEDPYPTDFQITILRVDDDDDDAATDESDDKFVPLFIKDGTHLGFHAGDLPRFVGIVRKFYYDLRQKRRLGAFGDTVDSSFSSKIFDELVMASTTCLLLCCPDHSTAWADRKRVLECNADSIIDDMICNETRFGNLLFTQHSKAPSSWSHRRWIHQRRRNYNYSEHVIDANASIMNQYTACERFLDYVKSEVEICDRVASSFPKNYYAWTYRIVVVRDFVRNICDLSDKRCIVLGFKLLQNEIKIIENKWLTRHVSDHSASHYGTMVLRLLVDLNFNSLSFCTESIRSMLKYVFGRIEFIRPIIASFPSHEVLWKYRRMNISTYMYLLDQLLDQCLSGEAKDELNDLGFLINDIGIKTEIYNNFSSEIKMSLCCFDNFESSMTARKGILDAAELNHARINSYTYLFWLSALLQASTATNKYLMGIGNGDLSRLLEVKEYLVDLTDKRLINHNFFRKSKSIGIGEIAIQSKNEKDY